MIATGGVIVTVARTVVDQLARRVRRIEEEVDPAARRTVVLVRAPGRAVIVVGVVVEMIGRQQEAVQRLKRTKNSKAKRGAGTVVARRRQETRR